MRNRDQVRLSTRQPACAKVSAAAIATRTPTRRRASIWPRCWAMRRRVPDGLAGQLAGAERSAAREGSVSLVGCAHDDDPLGFSGPGPQVCTSPGEKPIADSIAHTCRPTAVADLCAPLRYGIAGPAREHDGGMLMQSVRAAVLLLAWIALALGSVAQGAAGSRAGATCNNTGGRCNPSASTSVANDPAYAKARWC